MATPQLLIGKSIGRYHILEKLGAGGMGVVYRAHDERLHRIVALKLLAANIASHSEQWARILSEARAAAALNHPGITTIHEVAQEGEHIFIVMELIEGKSLRELLREGPMEPRAVTHLATQVTEALAVAHTHGVIHGDIKPENIMVSANQRIKLLDFGLARQLVEDSLTVTELATNETLRDPQLAGTLAYMAPEQFYGGPRDERTDLFSLGVVFYEMTAGRRPFHGPSATALAAQVMIDAPPCLSEEASGVPSELVRIIFKLLDKNPASRHQSAHELCVDLKNLSRDLKLGIRLPTAVANRTAVAVLPFKLLTPNPEDEYLRVALADPVINRLSACSDLLVRPINAVMRYAAQATDLMATAQELNVQILVDGSVQRFGQRLRVHVQAWNVQDGSSRLSDKYDAECIEMFELQDRIADALARELIPNLVPKVPLAPPTRNPVAYELFLRAMERMTRNNRWDTRIAIEMLENATVLDDQFADAWAGLAESCVQMGGIFEPTRKWLVQAEQAIRRALVLDPENVEAHVALGRIIWTPERKFQHRAALRALREPLRKRPTHDQALSWKGCILLHVGLQAEAKECLSTALAVSPDNTYTLTFLGTNAVYAGRYEEACECYARALSLDRTSFWANLLAPAAALYTGHLDQAEVAIRSAAQVLPGDPLLSSYEALLWAKRGERSKAEQLIQKAIHGEKSLLHTHHMMHTVAAAYGVLGKPRSALAWLRKASANGLPIYPAYRDDPHFACMRGQAQFQRFMAGLKKVWRSYQGEFGTSSGQDFL